MNAAAAPGSGPGATTETADPTAGDPGVFDPGPWGPAAATGVGSMPGTDIRETTRMVLETLPALPFLPELPARGPGADMIGRSIGLLPDLHARVEPSGWRIADRPGRDSRRARDRLSEDLDTLEEFTQGWSGALKVAVVGPWTLAATLERRNGEAMVGDHGARRDLVAALAEAAIDLVATVRRRVPGAKPVLQLDEPSLVSVLRGRVPTASGYRTHRAVDRQEVEEGLRRVIDSVGVPVVVHSCAPDVPFALLRRAGAHGVSFDLSLLTEREYDAVAESVEAGTTLFTGVLPGDGVDPGALSDPGATVMGVRSLWRGPGLSPALLPESVVITPACGLAGASPAYARAALAHCVRAARSLADNPE